MVADEVLVVRSVSGAGGVQQRHDEAGRRPADAAGRLDVLGGSLGLPHHDHDAEAIDVDADGNHVGREDDVDRGRVGVETPSCP